MSWVEKVENQLDTQEDLDSEKYGSVNNKTTCDVINRTLRNINDNFFAKIFNGFLTLNYFCLKAPSEGLCRSLILVREPCSSLTCFFAHRH